MSWLDGAIAITLALALFFGLWKGLVGILIPLAGLAVGTWLAGRYSTSLSSWLPLSGWLGKVLAFLIILALTAVLAALATFFLRKLLSLLMLGWVDRLLGAFLGLAIAGIGWSLLLALLIQVPSLEVSINSSRLASLLVGWSPLKL